MFFFLLAGIQGDAAPDTSLYLPIWRQAEALKTVEADESISLFKELLQLPQLEGDSLLANAHFELGLLYDQRSDYTNAHAHLDSAQALYRSIEHTRGVMRTTNSKGVVFLRQGSYDTAFDQFLNALELSIELNDNTTRITTLSNAGHVMFYQSDYDSAMEFYAEAERIARDNNL